MDIIKTLETLNQIQDLIDKLEKFERIAALCTLFDYVCEKSEFSKDEVMDTIKKSIQKKETLLFSKSYTLNKYPCR